MTSDVDCLTFTGWVDRPADIAPPLEGDAVCDVAVVGGGYAGMAAALRLAERGADVLLLESGFCGWGASSRNAGHLTPTIAGDPQILTTVYRRRAANLVRFASQAVHHTREMIEHLKIGCDYEQTGNVSAALSTGQLRRSERNARLLQALGAPVDFVEGRAAGLPDAFLGGIRERDGALMNPGMFALGLRDQVRRSPVRLFEQTPVQSAESTGSGVVISVPGGRVRAERAILATNAFTRDLPFAPKRIVAPIWTSVAETEPIAPDRFEATGWSSRAGIYTQHIILENYRPTTRGTIVFGTRVLRGARRPLGNRRPELKMLAEIERGFHQRFPTLSDVATARTWGGWIDMTPSWLPVVGEATPNLIYVVGFNGHGLAQAPYLGSLIADYVDGGVIHDDLHALWRPRPRFVPAPVFNGLGVRVAWGLDRLWERVALG